LWQQKSGGIFNAWEGGKEQVAAALFSKGTIDFLLGGGGIAFILQIQLFRPVASVANMTIKWRMEGFGLKRPGDSLAATLFEGIWFSAGGGVDNTNHFASGRSN
jgi:hypothetical protein